MYKQRGFTLLELAMVLTGVGLIVGGIIMGRALIHSSQLQSVVTDVNRYKDAVKLFNDKYKTLPGDMENASAFWAGGINSTTSDGFIGEAALAPNAAQVSSTEPLLVWQHLSLSGMLGGVVYTGTAPTNKLVPNTNIPSSKINGAGFYLRYAAPGVATGVFDGDYGHVIIFGTPYSTEKYPSLDVAITATDASEIDQKMDDGKPATGKVLSFNSDSIVTPNCATNNLSTAQYKETMRDNVCSLIFITGF
ncbi:MAG: hypothetical protein EBR02_05765 [Alphaproteobacteria bacterium]|nr:hypothetical protein [Alphaproteobacteria bacterium]